MLLLGVAGWLLKSTGFPRAPFLSGFVLAIPLERYYFLTDSHYEGFDWMLRPGTMVFIAILVLPILWNVFKWFRARRKLSADDDQLVDAAPDAEAPLKNSIWSLVTSAVLLVIFFASLVLSASYSPDARLVPQLIGWLGVIVALVLVLQELRSRKRVLASRQQVSVDASLYATAPSEAAVHSTGATALLSSGSAAVSESVVTTGRHSSGSIQPHQSANLAGAPGGRRMPRSPSAHSLGWEDSSCSPDSLDTSRQFQSSSLRSCLRLPERN
ncbi:MULTISPECIES: hypothetical protein [unclassified Arthrobacter]|uniref:hypothetical protein n=1 Tax=unclassified Arthrobacter TaxID=235627 RepID=UPI002156FCC3|nr:MULTISPECIES: hypothetical protein [unclassified Arthrobacter]